MRRLVAAPAGALVAALAAPPAAWANLPDSAVGSYHITVFLPESNGVEDPSLEDWTAPMEAEAVDQVLEACMHWADLAPAWAGLTCHVTFYHAADTPTRYEPITRPGGQPLFGFWGGDEDLWINELMDLLGHSSVWLFYYQEVESFNDAAQAEAGTDEAMSAFVVNSLNDEDGEFSNDMSAYVPEIRAPYLVMTWDNDGWRRVLGAEALRLVGAHEMGHVFGAEDEYSGSNSACADESNGYPTANHEDCPGGPRTSCIMRQDGPCGIIAPYPACYWTRGQIGWEPDCPPTGLCGLGGPVPCATGRECVDLSLLCDGVRGCSDASDELGCRGCEPGEYRCGDGSCEASFDVCECPDRDGDGFRGASCGGDDCDDGSPAANPGASEECNGVDDDCDGLVDEGYDWDGDGFAPCGPWPDCNDRNDGVFPGAPERCGDGVDQDCSGEDLACDCPDRDGDGLADHECGGTDCDDRDPTVLGPWPHCGDPVCDGGACPDRDGGPGGGADGGCGCGAASPRGGATARAISRLVLASFSRAR